MSASVSQPRLDGRTVARFALMLICLCAMLFVAAGTLRWPKAWLFVIVYIGGAVGSRLIVARRHPDLLVERAQAATAKGVKPWDKVLAPLVSLGGSLVLLFVAGLDYRFAWSSPIPWWIELVALGVLVLGIALGTWAMLENRFFSGVVRIQGERGHEVVSTGPYRYVRHPGYVGAILSYFAIPVALGTLWGLIPGVITSALVVARTALEDQTLRAELPGYEAYAQRVKWRLLPGVW